VSVSVGRYVLEESIGQGGTAEVFRAAVTSIGGFERKVAVKLLRAPYASDDEFIGMLLDEARIAGRLSHRNLVQTLDVGRADDELFYLVMEYVDGPSLRGLLQSTPDGRLPLEHALYVAMQLCEGLTAVHASPLEIVHRDVSPTNVLVSRLGEVKLADFGIAHAQSRMTRTAPGNVKGKLRYSAPEQLSGQRVDARADLYALGVVLLETCVGFSLWDNQDDHPAASILLGRASRSGVPVDVVAALSRVLRTHREERTGDARELRKLLGEALYSRQPNYGADDLAAFVSGLHIRALPPPAAWQRSVGVGARWPLAHRIIYWIGAAALGSAATMLPGAPLPKLSLGVAGASGAEYVVPRRPTPLLPRGEAGPKTPPGGPRRAASEGRADAEAAGPPGSAAPAGKLAVKARKGALIRVGKLSRRAPATIALPAGTHRVEVVLGPGRRVVKQVNVAAGRTAQLTIP
jgi:tRNA A-37 threonylcarbamoyl transferase component Bud32